MPGILPIVYVSQEIPKTGVILSVLTEAQESLSNIPNAPLQSWDWTPRL